MGQGLGGQALTGGGDGEVTVVTDETMGEEDPLLARLSAAATAGTAVSSVPTWIG